VLVSPSNNRLIPKRSKPQVEFRSGFMDAFEGLDLEDPAWRVNTATPEVTAKTTAYL